MTTSRHLKNIQYIDAALANVIEFIRQDTTPHLGQFLGEKVEIPEYETPKKPAKKEEEEAEYSEQTLIGFALLLLRKISDFKEVNLENYALLVRLGEVQRKLKDSTNLNSGAEPAWRNFKSFCAEKYPELKTALDVLYDLRNPLVHLRLLEGANLRTNHITLDQVLRECTALVTPADLPTKIQVLQRDLFTAFESYFKTDPDVEDKVTDLVKYPIPSLEKIFGPVLEERCKRIRTAMQKAMASIKVYAQDPSVSAEKQKAYAEALEKMQETVDLNFTFADFIERTPKYRQARLNFLTLYLARIAPLEEVKSTLTHCALFSQRN